MANLTGSASSEIDAPLDEVWAVVEDVISAPDWQGGMDAMTALEHDADGRPALVEVENLAHLERIMKAARRVKGVFEVARREHLTADE